MCKIRDNFIEEAGKGVLVLNKIMGRLKKNWTYMTIIILKIDIIIMISSTVLTLM